MKQARGQFRAMVDVEISEVPVAGCVVEGRRTEDNLQFK